MTNLIDYLIGSTAACVGLSIFYFWRGNMEWFQRALYAAFVFGAALIYGVVFA